ncbi:MAG TPA: hypothetical protein DDW59_01915, partial [Gammaproteobacteria bacterium]|nr:hypothetical protein [Gammaproteobacteria bacterium]
GKTNRYAFFQTIESKLSAPLRSNGHRRIGPRGPKSTPIATQNRTLRFFRLAMRKHTAAQSNVTTASAATTMT